MKSPFPGMDPYIEHCRLWKDFHAHLIEKIYDVVSVALPRKYLARVGERSYISLVEEQEKKGRHLKPDVSVTGPRERKRNRQSETQTATGGAAEQDSVALRAFIEEDFEERFIDIYEREPERRWSRASRSFHHRTRSRGSPGRKKYLRTRQALLLGRANLVEIDLLRGGARMPMLDPLPDSPYYLLVAREKTAPVCRVWRGFVDRPLPPISIPLCPPDHDIPLELQPFVEAIYERSRYGDDIDYAQPVVPPLTPEQTAWLQQQFQNTRTAGTAPAKRRPRRGNR